MITQNGRRAQAWVGHHIFRHTNATLLFRNGWNAKQVQMWLGHHSPALTLATYVHLLPDDLPEVPVTFGEWGNAGATERVEKGLDVTLTDEPKTAEILAVARAV